MADRYLLETGVAYAATIIGKSPAAYWRLGEPSGTNANDEIGTADGTYVGTPTLGATGALTGDADTAVTFNGTTQYITVPDSAPLDLGDVVTLECWVKRSSTGTWPWLIHKGTNGYGLAFDSTLSPAGSFGLAQAGVGFVAHSSVGITDTTTWHHLVATKNGSTRAIYLDGANVTTLDTNLTFANTATQLVIAAYATGSSDWLPGSLDEVAVYNYALTSTQVAAHYAVGLAGVHSGTDGYLLEDGSGVLLLEGAVGFDPAPFAGLYQIDEPTDWIASA